MEARRLHNRVPAYAHLIELVANDIDLALAKLVEADGPQTTITLHGPRKYRDAVTATVRSLGVVARRKGIRGDIVIDVASWQNARRGKSQ